MKGSRFKDTARTLVVDKAKSTASAFYAREKRYLVRNGYVWAAILVAAIILPVLCDAPWWVWLLIVIAAIIVPPVVMFYLAKIRYVGYIRLTRGVVTGITSGRMWQLFKTIRKAK